MPFLDRTDAGRRLEDRLNHLLGEGVVVLGVPRCGIRVAVEVAQALRTPLDVIVVESCVRPTGQRWSSARLAREGSAP
jgi:putative phosphoribosyl transferase